MHKQYRRVAVVGLAVAVLSAGQTASAQLVVNTNPLTSSLPLKSTIPTSPINSVSAKPVIVGLSLRGVGGQRGVVPTIADWRAGGRCPPSLSEWKPTRPGSICASNPNGSVLLSALAALCTPDGSSRCVIPQGKLTRVVPFPQTPEGPPAQLYYFDGVSVLAARAAGAPYSPPSGTTTAWALIANGAPLGSSGGAPGAKTCRPDASQAAPLGMNSHVPSTQLGANVTVFDILQSDGRYAASCAAQ